MVDDVVRVSPATVVFEFVIMDVSELMLGDDKHACVGEDKVGEEITLVALGLELFL